MQLGCLPLDAARWTDARYHHVERWLRDNLPGAAVRRGTQGYRAMRPAPLVQGMQVPVPTYSLDRWLARVMGPYQLAAPAQTGSVMRTRKRVKRVWFLLKHNQGTPSKRKSLREQKQPLATPALFRRVSFGLWTFSEHCVFLHTLPKKQCENRGFLLTFQVV